MEKSHLSTDFYRRFVFDEHTYMDKPWRQRHLDLLAAMHGFHDVHALDMLYQSRYSLRFFRFLGHKFDLTGDAQMALARPIL